MSVGRKLSRRSFVQVTTLAGAAALGRQPRLPTALNPTPRPAPLEEFSYRDVTLWSEPHEKQLRETRAILMNFSDDSLLKPFRQMAGQPAPGTDLGGWYHYDPDYDSENVIDGFAPSATFGQWISALARSYAIEASSATREKILRLNRLYAQTISPDFYIKNRFPAYCYDKLVCGLMDSHQFAGDPDAFSILEHTTNTALPHLPGKAIEHGRRWRENPGEGYTWDESYTISENLFIAYQRGAGVRYRSLATQYLDDEYYSALAEGRNNLAGRHAYSYVNSLSSAMQAYLTLGSETHLRSATNAFSMLSKQSFATGGWGPDEQLRAPDSDDLAASLTKTHSSFETPCGSYAHFKLTRYLLRVYRDSTYGDSMERVMYNTVLGAKPLLADGSAFYYSDCNFQAHKVYHNARWPCCSGTLPQVAADYRLNVYFRGQNSLYVNLFVPSTLRWAQDGAQLSVTQKSEYPFEGTVSFALTASTPVDFSLHLRIPQWAQNTIISVNGSRIPQSPIPGTFAEIRRQWKNGDRIDLEMPLNFRLESIDARHPEIVALLRGPLVLFPITDAPPTVTAQQLLAVKRTAAQSWQVESLTAPILMLPFTAIADQQYSTYLITTKT